MNVFKISTPPHSGETASSYVLLKRQSISEQPDCTILLTLVSGIKLPFIAYKDIKWQYNCWTGDETLKIRFKVYCTLCHVIFSLQRRAHIFSDVFYRFQKHSPDVTTNASVTTGILYNVSPFYNWQILKVKHAHFYHIIGMIVKQPPFPTCDHDYTTIWGPMSIGAEVEVKSLPNSDS